jgi:Tfp pilus assembly protein PilO
MSPALIRKAGRLPARQLHLVGAGVLLIAAAALWTYALRAPLAGLRAVRAEQARLQAAGGDPRLLSAQLAMLGTEAAALQRQLGAAGGAPAGQQLVGLIGRVGTLAAAHHVVLSGVTPAPEEQVITFRQAGFDADATGSYQTLLAWMAAVERSQANLSIARFDMHPAKAPGQIDMKIRIVAYRPQENTQ